MSQVNSFTRDEVLSKINSIDRNKSSFIGNLHDVTDWEIGDGKFDLTLDGETYHFGPHAQSQLLKKLRIPRAYFDICSKDLRDQELREGFETLERGAENRFKFWYNPETQEKTIYGFIPKNCEDILPSQIIEKVFDGMGALNNVFTNQCYHTLVQIRLRIVDPNFNFSTISNDELFPMVDVIFSDVLTTPIKVQSGLYRKVCSNGMVVPVELNNAFTMPLTRYREDLFNQHIQYVNDSASRLDVISKAFIELKQIELPEALIDADKDERNSFDEVFEYVIPRKPDRGDIDVLVRNKFNTAEEHNVFGLINAVTATVREWSGGDMDPNKQLIEESVGNFITRVAIQEQNRGFTYNKESLDDLFKKKKKFRAVNVNSMPTMQTPTTTA